MGAMFARTQSCTGLCTDLSAPERIQGHRSEAETRSCAQPHLGQENFKTGEVW
jgi:hypothetical protein